MVQIPRPHHLCMAVWRTDETAKVYAEFIGKLCLMARTQKTCHEKGEDCGRGRVNMLDISSVQRMSFEMGFYELVYFIEEDRAAYVWFILTGEEVPMR